MVDDRPSSLTAALFRRTDVQPVLLRFRSVAHQLPAAYREDTLRWPTFVLDETAPLENEVARFRCWAATLRLSMLRFCNHSEPQQRLSQHFARLAGLPALREEQVGWLRDKAAMKDKLREIGFRVAEHAPATDAEDIYRFAERHGWPLVIKPREGFACINTFRLAGVEDLDRLSLTPGRWLVEKFIPHKEYECCALIMDGRVLGAYLSYFPASPLAATDGAINANISIPVPRGFPVDPVAMVQCVVDGMDLDHGYMHLEFFLSRHGEITFSEVALRLAGCEIPANHGLACDFNIFDALIDIHLGRQPRVKRVHQRCVGDLLLPAQTGLVTDVTPVENLLLLDGVIGGKLKVRPGSVIPPGRASHRSSGHVHVEGRTLSQVIRRMRRVLREFAIRTAEPTFIAPSVSRR